MLNKRGAGFTLVEVMVALAVVAIALPALVMSLYYQVDGTEHLRDKALAQMVASNKLAELRLLSQARQSLLKGSDNGQATLAGRQWSWRIESSETPVEAFFRVEITVRAGEHVEQGPALYSLVAFMGADLDSEIGRQVPAEAGSGGS